MIKKKKQIYEIIGFVVLDTPEESGRAGVGFGQLRSNRVTNLDPGVPGLSSGDLD